MEIGSITQMLQLVNVLISVKQLSAAAGWSAGLHIAQNAILYLK